MRRRISDVVELRELLNRAMSEVDWLSHSKVNYWWYVLGSGLVGFLFLLGSFSNLAFTIIGVLGFGTGGFFYFYRINPVERLLTEKNQELAAICLAVDRELSSLAKNVLQELSETHDARVRPRVTHVVIDFARIIQAAKGRGLILESVRCPRCDAAVSLPKEGNTFQCDHCGSTIHATDIFEKLKLST